MKNERKIVSHGRTEVNTRTRNKDYKLQETGEIK
jgi:hypothetical protein